MIDVMRLGATVLIVGAIGLAGCGAGAADERSGGDGATTTQATGSAVHEGNAPGVPPLDGPVQRTASGLGYIDEAVGDGAEAQRGQTVRVHYTGWLTSGQKFDSSRDKGQPFAFLLGSGQVIRGWDEGVAGMRVGGKRRLVVPAALGYGERGFPGVIPPGATLLFDVELLDTR